MLAPMVFAQHLYLRIRPQPIDNYLCQHACSFLLCWMQFAMFSRMSFDRAQMVTIIAGGHTMANLEGASLDGTPWTFDNVWQQ